MPKPNDSLKERLSKSSEMTITVTGRKSGRAISNPVWFVLDGNRLHLLPVKGSDTQWYNNVLKNPSIRVEVGGVHADLKVAPITDSAQVKSIVEKFRAKYGRGDVKKYYSKLDVAIVAQLP